MTIHWFNGVRSVPFSIAMGAVESMIILKGGAAVNFDCKNLLYGAKVYLYIAAKNSSVPSVLMSLPNTSLDATHSQRIVYELPLIGFYCMEVWVVMIYWPCAKYLQTKVN